jgi:signal transduction histidine kinase
MRSSLLRLPLIAPLLLASALGGDTREHRVLVIHSYRSGYEWTDLLTRGLTRVLEDSDLDVRADFEFMDSVRRPGEKGQFAERLQARYGHVPLDAIVAFDDAAARFLAVDYGELFPQVPVVFAGVSDRELIQRMSERFCGIEEVFDLKRTLDLALRLHPKVRNVHLVVDDTPFAEALSSLFASLEPHYRNVRFERLNGGRMGREALYEELRKVSPQDLVFLVSFMRDGDGHLSQKRMLEAVAAASAGPVWAMATAEMGQGLFAGRTNGGIHHGRLAAESLLRVLRGATPESVGRIRDQDSPLIFDRLQLARHGVSLADLPPDAVVWIREPSLWQRYRWWIAAGLTFLAMQTALIAALVRNVFRRRRAEEALTKSNEELAAALRAAREAGEVKSRFLANMSHEIRTPMNGILGTAELLADSPLTPEQREGLETIRGSAVALLNLLNDLLDLSRMEAGQLALEKAPFSPAGMLQEVARLMAPQVRRERLHLETHAAPLLPEKAIGDPLRIRQVLLNLTGNALKFTREGGVRLSVSVEEGADGGRLRFEVKDTGPGIAPEHREVIFMRFRQLDQPQAKHYGGAGLGLAIAKELVTAMGGEIGVESEVGKGSQFWFTIPLVATPEETKGSRDAERVGFR